MANSDPDSFKPRRLAIDQQHDEKQADGNQVFVRVKARQKGNAGKVLNARRDGNGNGQHIVNQQRARRNQTPVRAEIFFGDDVTAAPAWIRENGLPVRGDDDDKQGDNQAGNEQRVMGIRPARGAANPAAPMTRTISCVA